jgi:hypothetical protein
MAAVKKVTPIRESSDMRTIIARIEERTAMMVERFDSVDERISKLVDAMSHLPVLSERQTTMREDLDKQVADRVDKERRLQVIEGALPSLLEVRKWIVLGVMGIMALVGTAAWDFVVPPKRYIVNVAPPVASAKEEPRPAQSVTADPTAR